MYTICMNKEKRLITTQKITIYQREKLVDKIQFLFPEEYNDMPLNDFTAELKYVDQANVPHVEILKKDSELYKGKLRYVLPIDSNLTRYAGDIKIRITFLKTDYEEKTQYVLHTGETIIAISPISDYYNFIPDESLEFVDQIVCNLEAKLEAVDKIASAYDLQKADNITYDDNKLQLTSNGNKIGDSITIITGGGDNPGVSDKDFEVVEF